MNDCEKYQELCSAYFDGELTAAEQAELRAHLAVCPECDAYLQALRQVRATLSGDAVQMPGDLHEEVMELVLAEAQKSVVQTAKPRRRPPVFTMLAAAVVAVMLVLTGTVGDLISSGRGLLGLDDAKSAGSGAMAKTRAAADDDSEAEIAPFSAATGDAGAQNAGAAQSAAQAEPGASAKSASDSAAEQDGPQKQARSFTAVPGTDADNAAPVLETPESLHEQSFAFCYVATGTGEAPSIEATYLDQSADGTTSYYSIKNNMSVLEKVLTTLSKGGFEPKQYDSISNVLLDSKAGNGLIVVIKKG